MFNYKLRGRPDDPKNKLASEKRNALSLAIKVNGIFQASQAIPEKELMRTRQHYAEYVKSYEDKHLKSTTMPSLRKGTTAPVKRYKFNDGAQNLDKYLTARKSSTKVVPKKERLPFVNEKPLSKRPLNRNMRSLAATSDYDQEDLLSKASTLYTPRIRDEGALQLVERLRRMEDEYARMVEDVRPNIHTLINQTDNDVSVATTQLEEIKKLLRNQGPTADELKESLFEMSQSTSTSTTTGDFDKISCEIDGNEISRRKKCVESIKAKMKESKKRKMVLTLNQLNKKIDEMQEKYFSAPKNRYVSLNDLEKQERFKKKIEVLYENDDFDPDKEISNILLNCKRDRASILANIEKGKQVLDTVKSSCIQTGSDLRDNNESVAFKVDTRKEIKIVPRSTTNNKKSDGDLVTRKRVRFSSDMSSDNYLFNKVVERSNNYSSGALNFDSSTDTIGLDENINDDDNNQSAMSIPEIGDINSNINYFDVDVSKMDALTSPKECHSRANNNQQQLESDDDDDDNNNNNNGLQSIQESILKSDFLMKEFNLTPNDLRLGLRNFASTPGLRKNVNSMPNPQEYFKQRNERADSLRKAYLDDSIRQQLKNSLYQI